MAVGQMPRWSLRPESDETFRLARAFGYSLGAHLLAFLLWVLLTVAARNHWLDHVPFIKSSRLVEQMTRKVEPPTPQTEPPLVFLDVSPAQASTEPPKDAKFYSDRNSRAANPDTRQDSTVPKIDGTQTDMVKTEDSERRKFMPLQPSPVAQPAKEEQEEAKPKPVEPKGDLAMAKPETEKRAGEGAAPRPKPRTISEARARQLPQSSQPGLRSKQEGGVRRHMDITSLDAKATPFGAYDRALIDAIAQRWYALLDERGYASDERGKVVLQFVLHPDGRVSEMSIAANSAGEMLGLICQKAVLDPAPFAVWPSDMRRILGETRPIQFTFYYN